jgi:tetratricopeptide (TPR) repeat protein
MSWGKHALVAVALLGPLVGPARARAAGSGDEEPAAGEEKPKSPEQKQAFAHFLRAQELYRLGRYREAIARLEAAVKLDPKAADLYYNLGIVHEKLGEVDEAIAAYETYLKLLGPDADAEEIKRIRGFIQRLKGARSDLTAREAKKMEHRFTPLTTSLVIGGTAALGATIVCSWLAIRDDHAARDYQVGSDGGLGRRQTMINRSRIEAVLADVFGGLTLVAGGAAIAVYFGTEYPKEDDPRAVTPRRAAWIGVTPIPGGGGAVQLGMVF